MPLPRPRADLEITLIANYITLTPGTLTVDVSPDRRTLLIHSLLAGDSGDGVRADVAGRDRAARAEGDAAMILDDRTHRRSRRGAGDHHALPGRWRCSRAAWRLLVGPELADRVVALDMVSMILVVFLVLFKLVSGENAYIYVAIALALIAFLATVAFANYIDRARGDADE